MTGRASPAAPFRARLIDRLAAAAERTGMFAQTAVAAELLMWLTLSDLFLTQPAVRRR